MLKRKSLLVILALLLIFSLTLIGCGGADDDELDDVFDDASDDDEVVDDDEDEVSEADGRLIVAQHADVQSLDPQRVNDVASFWVMNQMYEGLVRRTDDMGVEPALAESWEEVDERTFRFFLRQGVTFHNGEEFTAEDVKFSIERLLDPDFASPGASRLNMVDVENIEIIDEYTIDIPTNEPFGPLLTYLAHSASFIVNKEAIEEFGDDSGANPVGTGPFMLKDWNIGNEVVLERFDDHWREPAKSKELVFRVIPENTNRVIELETGNIHIAKSIDPGDMSRVREHQDLVLYDGDALRIGYVGLNTSRPPFDDIRVRQAMNYAVDSEEVVRVVYGDLGSPATTFMNTGIWSFNPDVRQYDRDLDRARELLEEAGYPDGFEIDVLVDENQQRRDTIEILNNQLGQLGVEMNIQVLEWGTYLERTGEGEADLFVLAWLASTGDPHHALFNLFHSVQHGANGNRSFYTNEDVDRLLDEGLVELDQDARYEIYQEAQELIAEDAPWIPIWNEGNADAVRIEVEGFTQSPSGYHFLENVYVGD